MKTVTPGTRDGWFGRYGGRFAPETLMGPLLELERAFNEAQADAKLGQVLRTWPSSRRPSRGPSEVGRGAHLEKWTGNPPFGGHLAS